MSKCHKVTVETLKFMYYWLESIKKKPVLNILHQLSESEGEKKCLEREGH